MKDSEIKETIEAHEEAITDIHSEIEELKEKLAADNSRWIQIEVILDTHRVEIKALSGLFKSLLKQVAQIESDLITGEAAP